MTSESSYFHPIDTSDSQSKAPMSVGYHVQMPVYSPEEVIHMIETVSADPKVKDELTAIIRRSAKLSEQRAALSLSITNICGYSSETVIGGIGDDTGYVVPEGISYDKSQNRYRTSYKDGKRLVQKVFSIRAHGEKKALNMAVEQRKQWIREGKVPMKGVRKEPMKNDYPRGNRSSIESNTHSSMSEEESVPSSINSHVSNRGSTQNYSKYSNVNRSRMYSQPMKLDNSSMLGGDDDSLTPTYSSFSTPPPSAYDHSPVESSNNSLGSADMAFLLNTFGGSDANGQSSNSTVTQNNDPNSSIPYLTNINMSVATGTFAPF